MVVVAAAGCAVGRDGRLYVAAIVVTKRWPQLETCYRNNFGNEETAASLVKLNT